MRRAIDGGEYQPLSEYLSGPSALTFVEGDISAVAKALRDFSRANPLLVIKGGLADGSLLSPADLAALADLPPREVLLARLAGALAAPMQQMAGLLKALPQNFAYGISALRDQREAADGGSNRRAGRARTPRRRAGRRGGTRRGGCGGGTGGGRRGGGWRRRRGGQCRRGLRVGPKKLTAPGAGTTTKTEIQDRSKERKARTWQP